MQADFDPQDPFAGMDDLDQARVGRSNRIKFECSYCGGSGLWQAGRRNQHGNNKCHACQGKGYTLTDPRKLLEARQKSAQKKMGDLTAFRDEHEEIIKIIRGAAGWSTFAESLYAQLATKVWSDKQLAAARSMAAKLVARQEEKATANAAARTAAQAAKVEIDLTAIRAMFEQAVASGYKKPKYRAEGLEITRAPDSGRNPGALYIVDEQADYQGKMIGVLYEPTRTALASTKERLIQIAADPLAAALRYGQRTGRCACCGKELTNHASIDLGIGPICKKKWGL